MRTRNRPRLRQANTVEVGDSIAIESRWRTVSNIRAHPSDGPVHRLTLTTAEAGSITLPADEVISVITRPSR